MSCQHASLLQIRPPRSVDVVYKEDCTLCFDSVDDTDGLDVCLSCYNGACSATSRSHSKLHYSTTKHPLALNIRRQLRPNSNQPAQPHKLAIAAESDADRYNYITTVKCYHCNIDTVDHSQPPLDAAVNGILQATSFTQKEAIKAWEPEVTACEHTLCVEQQTSTKIASQSLGQCSSCELQENLWLCLTCGNLGCGRAQWGGVGGNSHALAHSDDVGHHVAVKLGSLTADGTADVFCYKCGEERVDPELATHLAHWGIDIRDRQKTEKSLNEMQLEQNLKWDFSMTGGDGQDLKPVFGPGLTGLKNLGNTCYMNSCIQALFSLEGFQSRFRQPIEKLNTSDDPANNLEIQMRKLADGVLSGRYSIPHPGAPIPDGEFSWQRGLAPTMLKAIVGKDHPEFSTMRQQDALEFLQHFFDKLSKEQDRERPNVVDDFAFLTEQRLQCLKCSRVRYSSQEERDITINAPAREVDGSGSEGEKGPQFEAVSLYECLDLFTDKQIVDLDCSSCGEKQKFSKQTLFKTFPKVLIVQASRFALVNWVPTKQDVPVIVPDDDILLDKYVSTGLLDGEETLPDEAASGQDATAFAPNPETKALLLAMGFPEARCVKALYHTNNQDADSAMNWLFAHMEDPEIDEPLQLGSNQGGGPELSSATTEALIGMGFSREQAEWAARNTNSDLEAAVEYIFSQPYEPSSGRPKDESASSEGERFAKPSLPVRYSLQAVVCHKGSSIHVGHYVAFVRKEVKKGEGRRWVLFNDEKVAEVPEGDEMKRFGYLYFLRLV